MKGKDLDSLDSSSEQIEANKIAHIDILANAAIITYNEQGSFDKKVCKTIKLETLIKAFQTTQTKLVSPILPNNCIKYEEKGNTVIVRLLHEQTKFTATCFGKVYEEVIRPTCLMTYKLNKQGETYSIIGTELFGIIDDPLLISNNTQLYGLPFPNISANGWICWGNNSIAGNFRSLTGLKVYIERLFKAPFNDHVFNTGFLRNFGINGPADLFKYLQGKEKFPNEILENLGTGHTIGSL